MTRIAFCGLGQMGAPMARRLVEAGHEVAVWNRTAEKAEPLREAGARVAGSPGAAARQAEAVVTMLATPEALHEVVRGDGGLASGMRPGSALIEMSTVGPEVVRGLPEMLPEGVEVIDAPVLGTVLQAESGELKVFVGGEREAFERWRPILEAMGTPLHAGPQGAGAALKLVVNSTLGALMVGLGEALALADKVGLEEGLVLDVLSDSAIGVTARSKRDRIESGKYPPNFKLELAVKDLALVADAADGCDLELRVSAAARRWLTEAEGAGSGNLDYSAVIAFIRGQAASA
ncbi:MAG TPA: NAD(P)-dependent oxidoreductase [Actinomycetota bacterium]